MTKPSHIERKQTADGRRYTVATPAGEGGVEMRPLVVALHYGGQVSPWYGEELLAGLVEPALRELEAVIIAPDCNAGVWHNRRSEAEVLSLLDMAMEQYGTDSGRVLLTGYSLGGMGTWYIAGRNQDRFSAALPMAGRPPAEILDHEWRIPVRILHGREDELFPWQAAAEAADRLLGQGTRAELLLLDGVSHFESGLFVDPLRQSAPWIRAIWGESSA